MRVRPQRDRVVSRLVLAAAIIARTGVAIGAAGLPMYVFPAIDDPHGVDAVMVLGPPEPARFVAAERVSAENGGVPIVVSAPASGPLAIAELPICRERNVTCRTPEPFTTLGEALVVRDLASQHGWDRVAVVTATPHVSRSRFLFDRCASTAVRMVSSGVTDPSPAGWAYQYAYQTAAFVKALVIPC